MAWSVPRTWVAGEIITASIGNTHWRDQLRYLKGLDGAVTLSDALILPDGAGYYLHIPILTTIQRDALTPTAGMVVYNSTTTQFNKYENAFWRADLGFNSHHGGLSGLTDDDHTIYVQESLLTTQADLPYATAASTWTRLPKGLEGKYLRMNSGATAPEWSESTDDVSALIGVTENLIQSNDAGKWTVSLTYVKLKETKLDQVPPIALRIKFYLLCSNAGRTGYAQLYRNGGAIGTERSVTNSSATFSEDFNSSTWLTNDLIQIYVKASHADTAASVTNFRIYFGFVLSATNQDP